MLLLRFVFIFLRAEFARPMPAAVTGCTRRILKMVAMFGNNFGFISGKVAIRVAGLADVCIFVCSFQAKTELHCLPGAYLCVHGCERIKILQDYLHFIYNVFILCLKFRGCLLLVATAVSRHTTFNFGQQ